MYAVSRKGKLEMINRYAIRKRKLGVGSVLVGMVLFGMPVCIVNAQENNMEVIDSVAPGLMVDSVIAEKQSDAIMEESKLEETVELVNNADFSESEVATKGWTQDKPQDWDLWIAKDSTNVDYQAGLTENGEVMLRSEQEPFKAVVKQTLQVDATKQYELSYDIKTENISKGKVYVRFIENQNKTKVGLWDSGVKLNQTNDWQTYTKEYVPQATVNNIVLELHFDRAVGTALFDNVHLREIEKMIHTPAVTPQQPVNMITNGDFSVVEDAKSSWRGKMASDWQIWVDKQHMPKQYTAEITEHGVLKLGSEQESFRAVVKQEHTLERDTKYRVAFRVKTEQMTGIARLRIIEREGNKQRNLWYGPENMTGTNDWQTLAKEYVPLNGVDNIVVELFFDKGTGVAYFDDISIIPTEKIDRHQSLITVKPETLIRLTLGKRYIPQLLEHRYEVEDSTIAKVEKGLLTGVQLGKTKVNIYHVHTGDLVGSIPIEVQKEQEYNREAIERWNDIVAGNAAYDPNNSTMVEQNKRLDQVVETILNEYVKDANRRFLWSDASDYEVSSNLTKTYRKLETIAKQVTHQYSRFYQDERAARTIKNAMEWLHLNVYNSSKDIVGNWWDYEIGTPRAINNTLSLMHEYFTQEEIVRYTDVIDKFVPDPTMFRYTTDPFKAIGGNLIDMGRVKIIESLLRNDDTMLGVAVMSLAEAFENVTQGEGFYEDGSYIAHTNVAYTGAYGSVFIDGISQLIPIVQSSSHSIPEEKLNILYQWIERAFLPIIYKGELMDMTRGRALSREKQEAHVAAVEVMRGILRIADVAHADKKMALQRAVKTIVEQDTYYDVFDNLVSYRDIYLMQQLKDDSSIKVLDSQSFLQIFHNMDKVVFRNESKDFGFAISMHSNRTLNYEYMNGENARGWHLSDGMVYLYNGDLSHYSEHYWPTVNASLLAGTTVVPKRRIAGEGQSTMQSSFVGGAKLSEELGTIAMDFYNWDASLHIQKAWFILGDKIVFLGSNLENNSGIQPITTIENRKVGDSAYQVYVNGELQKPFVNGALKGVKDVFYEGKDTKRHIGYLMWEATDLNLSRHIHEGKWNDVNKNGSDDLRKNEYISLHQSHGATSKGYAYMMLPNTTRDEFNQFVAQPTITVVVNNELHQVVYDAALKVWGVVKYSDVPYRLNADLTLTKAGMYTIQQSGKGYLLAYHHPREKINANQSVIETTQDIKLIKDWQTHDEAYHFLLIPKSKEQSQINNGVPEKIKEHLDSSSQKTPSIEPKPIAQERDVHTRENFHHNLAVEDAKDQTTSVSSQSAVTRTSQLKKLSNKFKFLSIKAILLRLWQIIFAQIWYRF